MTPTPPRTIPKNFLQNVALLNFGVALPVALVLTSPHRRHLRWEAVTEWTPSELMPDSSFAPRAAAATTTTKTDAIAPKSKRITGIDMARGIAMAGMTVVHFVAWWEGQGALLSLIHI